MKALSKSKKSAVFAVVRILALTWVIALVAVFFLQERLLFFPTTLAPDHKFGFGGEFEEHSFTSGNDSLHSVLFRIHPRRVILFFHGNAGSNHDWGHVARWMGLRNDWSIWVVDYPGFGKSTGAISSEKQLIEMARAFYDLAKKTFGDDAEIAVFGRSIGTGIATALAAEKEVARVMLETPFLNLASLALKHYPWAPGVLLKYPFRSDLALAKVSAPILILHGDADKIIPFEHGKRLAEVAKTTRFVAIPKGGHNNLGEHPEYWTAVAEFLK